MDYFEYRRSLESALSQLKLPSDCTQREPTWEPIDPPVGWIVEVFFDFADEKHVRIWENHDKIAGLQMSRRIHWAYHYGVNTVKDAEGLALHGAPEDPLDLRIDNCGGGRPHLHYEKQDPHYEQSQISGLDLAAVTALDFVRAVLKHRRTGMPLSKALGFRIKGK